MNKPGSKPNLWQEFRAWEEEAAAKGSGLTKDQMTGASLFHAWLTERERAQSTKVLRFGMPIPQGGSPTDAA